MTLKEYYELTEKGLMTDEKLQQLTKEREEIEKKIIEDDRLQYINYLKSIKDDYNNICVESRNWAMYTFRYRGSIKTTYRYNVITGTKEDLIKDFREAGITKFTYNYSKRTEDGRDIFVKEIIEEKDYDKWINDELYGTVKMIL